MGQPAQSAKKRVLIVDDSKFVRTTFSRILEATFTVREEADGAAAWRAIQDDPTVAMVFTDLNMPDLDGFGLMERIRKSADARIRALPIVVISGSQSEASMRRVREAGANDFISKSADAPEVLSRIAKLLRLAEPQPAAAMHDALTGTFTPQYLVIEGRKRYSYARRHGGPLSVMALRVESHAEVAQKAGKEVAEQILVRIAKLVAGTLRTEDSIGRVAEATFLVIFAATTAAQATVVARRLHAQLERAQVSYGKAALKMHTSFGIASLDADTAGSIEELIRAALQRLQDPAAPALEKPAAAPGRLERSALPAEVERALQVLEKLDAEQLGEAANEILRRLLPFVRATLKRRLKGRALPSAPR